MQFSLVVGVLVGIFQTQTGRRFCDWNTGVIIDQHLSPQFPPLVKRLRQNSLIHNGSRVPGESHTAGEVALGIDRNESRKSKTRVALESPNSQREQ